MAEGHDLTPAVVDDVSLERALQDAEAANLRVIELTQQLLDQDERIAKLNAEVVGMKRIMDPRRRAEHIFRKNHALYVVARQTKRMLGR